VADLAVEAGLGGDGIVGLNEDLGGVAWIEVARAGKEGGLRAGVGEGERTHGHRERTAEDVEPAATGPCEEGLRGARAEQRSAGPVGTDREVAGNRCGLGRLGRRTLRYIVLWPQQAGQSSEGSTEASEEEKTRTGAHESAMGF